jgi:hypothetical protein
MILHNDKYFLHIDNFYDWLMVYFIDSVECQNNANRIGTVMVSLLASSVVDLLDEYAIVSVGSFQRL